MGTGQQVTIRQAVGRRGWARSSPDFIGPKHFQPAVSSCKSRTSIYALSRPHLEGCPRAQLPQSTWGRPLWAILVPEHRLQRPCGRAAAASPGSQLAPSCTPNHLERPIPPTPRHPSPRQCDATASRVKMIWERESGQTSNNVGISRLWSPPIVAQDT